MHLLTRATPVVLALLSSVVTSPIDPATADTVALDPFNQTVADPDPEKPLVKCTWNFKMFPIPRAEYRVTIKPLPEPHEASDMCHKFWASLREWPLCTVSSPHNCGFAPKPFPDRHLYWLFHTATFCNTGMVESAFWGATGRGQLGHVYPCEMVGFGSDPFNPNPGMID